MFSINCFFTRNSYDTDTQNKIHLPLFVFAVQLPLQEHAFVHLWQLRMHLHTLGLHCPPLQLQLPFDFLFGLVEFMSCL